MLSGTMKTFQAVLCLGLLLASASSATACTDIDCGGFNLANVCSWQYGDRCQGVTRGGGAYDWKAQVRGVGASGMDLSGYVRAKAASIIAQCLPAGNPQKLASLKPTCGNDRDAGCWRITATVC